jgi:hypothetical protein
MMVYKKHLKLFCIIQYSSPLHFCVVISIYRLRNPQLTYTYGRMYVRLT